MSRRLSRMLLAKQSGQGLMEYGLTIVLVAIAVIIVVTVLGSDIGDLYQTAIDALPFWD